MNKKAFIFLCCICSTAVHAEPVRTIQSKDLGTATQVIGVLNLPLGTIVSIDGEATYELPRETKNDSTALPVLVTKVNGASLETPKAIALIVTNASKISLPKPGEHCKFRGFESGSFIGLPPDALKETGASMSAKPWHFVTVFHILNTIP